MTTEKSFKPRKRPQQDRSKITNNAILEATTHILSEKGYDKLTTNRIAKKAGISIGSLYQYYPNKESIISELISRSYQQDRDFIESKLSELKEAPIETTVKRLIHALMERCDSNLIVAKALREQIPRVEWTNKVRKTTSYLENMIFDLLKLRHSTVNDNHLKKVAFIVVHTIDGIVNEALFTRPEWLSDKEFRNSACHMIKRYIQFEVKSEG